MLDTTNVQTKTRILMVDDHPIVCESMAQFLNLHDNLCLCCQATNALEALAAMQTCRHDLCIVDLSLDNNCGLDLITKLRSLYPTVSILTLSMHDESVFAEPVLRAGANGYLMKQESTGTILKAIQQIMTGNLYLSDAMQHGIAQRMIGTRGAGSLPVTGITERESEVLDLLGLGFGTREIAEMLGRSAKTVETHLANLKQKLQIKSGRDLTRFALQRGRSERGSPRKLI